MTLSCKFKQNSFKIDKSSQFLLQIRVFGALKHELLFTHATGANKNPARDRDALAGSLLFNFFKAYYLTCLRTFLLILAGYLA